MQDDVIRDFDWAERFKPEINKTLQVNLASEVIEWVTSSKLDDLKHATDLVPHIKTGDGDVAMRVRLFKAKSTEMRDLTIRCHRRSKVKTELEKISGGWAKWYFYGWTYIDEAIDEWMIIRLDRLRAVGRLRDRPEISNTDSGGTRFIAIPAIELKDAGCIVSHDIKSFTGEIPDEIIKRDCSGFRDTRGMSTADLVTCPKCEKPTDPDLMLNRYPASKSMCMSCSTKAQADDDEKRWDGITLAKPKPTEKFPEGHPYAGFRMTTNVTPDPGRVAKATLDVESHKRRSDNFVVDILGGWTSRKRKK